MNVGETIVAISSAAGPAARMVVRLSGPRSQGLVRQMTGEALAGGGGAARATLRFGGLEVGAWLYTFAAPASYTGEDVVEVHLPGNALLAGLLVEDLVARGARQAEAGEFTARAYFNGKMDLAQAEGVAMTIAAHGEEELEAARQLRAGELTRRLEPIMDELAQMLALVEAEIDFSEEGVAFLLPGELEGRLDGAMARVEELIRSSARFERLSHEATFALAGRANAGKSTLLNALAGRDRAVVSPEAGTTRDVLWAHVATDRGLIRVVDAAGMGEAPPAESDHSAGAQIARQMERRAAQAVREADFVVLVREVGDERPAPELGRRPDVVVRSKCDLRGPTSHDASELAVSALSGEGMDALRSTMAQLAYGRPSGASLALSARHRGALAETMEGLERARRAQGAEVVAMEVRGALESIACIGGRIAPDDLLGRIFSTFCIGK